MMGNNALKKNKERRKKKKSMVFSKKVKIVILGDERVGKTSIAKRYCLGGLSDGKKMKDYMFDFKE